MIALARLLLVFCVTVPVCAAAQDVPKIKQTKLALYLSSTEAADVIRAGRSKVLFIDVRTRAEIQFVGYTAEIDGVVPFVELSQFGDWDEANNRYKLEPNATFSDGVMRLLTAKGLTKADKVIVICRSGDRSARAVDALSLAGFTNVYSVVDGFEGDLSPEGRRTVNGWKNAGLPWTYKLEKVKVFIPLN